MRDLISRDAMTRTAGGEGRAPAGLGLALAFTALSVLLPGVAHLRAGRRRVGIALLAGAVTGTGGTAAWLVLAPDAVARLSVRPAAVTMVMFVSTALAFGWAAVIARSYAVLRPPGPRGATRVAAAGLVGVLCAAAAAPPLAVSRYAYLQRDLLTSIFPADPARPARAGAPAGGTGRGAGPAAPFDGRPRINVLLMGGDAGPDRWGVRPDSMTVASIDTGTGDTVLLSLPRNLEGAAMPPGRLRARFPKGYPGLLNELYMYAVTHPDAVPGAARPGPEVMKQVVGHLLGLPVHYHALIDLAGFRDLVDAIGGVRICVTEPIVYDLRGYRLAPGCRRLNGIDALRYSRSRIGGSDYTRMRRQRCMLVALARQAEPLRVLTNFRRLAATAKGMISTDIPRRVLPDVVDLAPKVRRGQVLTLQFIPPRFLPWQPDLDRMRRMTRQAIAQSGEPVTGVPAAQPIGAACTGALDGGPRPPAPVPGVTARVR